jgi:hypothetical protein
MKRSFAVTMFGRLLAAHEAVLLFATRWEDRGDYGVTIPAVGRTARR